ncbi:citrate synthase [Luminiphilus syltensis NOR5-1B]|uniref:citrate synthase (unknown stereospecificity) n=1 Tax=Luminiphilus syltensis NOR5-1B TaxID=565045 RepID=B8KSF8_9GAMM|nr:citryl-CoA lyase [Luminiphilus syltensis]EED36871.1 citrate synthase [Luminiphilus syltensis NOR5-1B]
MTTDNQPTTRICGYDADSITLRGKDLVADVIGNYSFTGAFLLQALGKEPTKRQMALVDAVLVTIMEHGLVPSAVVSRLTLHGAPESFQGAIAAGLLGVGDRYAGTAGKCGELAERIISSGDIDGEAVKVVAEHRSIKRPVPGFGHPIHTGRDPRVEKLLEMLSDESPARRTMFALESAISDALGRSLVMNVSAVLAALLIEADVPPAMMRGVVLVARCAGLVGHVLEESTDPVGHALWQGAQGAVSYQED